MTNQIEFVQALQSRFAVEHVKDDLKVNLTQMSKPFGRSKRPERWLKTKESIDYIRAMSVAPKSATADLLIVRQGGDSKLQGTWSTDWRIAIRFAQWLSPEFSLAVDSLILKLLKKDAVITEPIAGVWPLVYNGQIGYPRREILSASGYSPNSGSNTYRKRRFPEHHFTIYRTACYTPFFARHIFEQGRTRQLMLFPAN